MADVVVRPFRESDSPAVQRLAGEASTEDELVPLAPDRDVVFVAEVEGHPAGYVALREDGRALVVDQMVVAPADQGRHVGHRLLDWAEGYGTSLGMDRVCVPAAGSDRRARDFYARRGYLDADGSLVRHIAHVDA
jgi:N-acetylglutamate synthase-like GNAT family acetyltransferase